VTGVFDPALQRELDALAVPGLLIGHRVIATGDEKALRGEEAAALASRPPAARRASGAARIVARELLARLGYLDALLPKGAAGEPLWPACIVGSLAHDDDVAVAAVALRRDFASIGIDVEPARALPADMLELVVTPPERRMIGDDLLHAKLLFAAKEAVYKAVYPLDTVFLEFSDIAVDLAAGKATTRNGRIVSLRYSTAAHIVALALLRADQA
jgi:4'-phosphopantetheinyl transferase EntD